jgi:hypothetical protein
MAIGDVVHGLSSIANSSVLDIRPSEGVELVVHNIYYNQGTIEIYVTNGINTLLFDDDTLKGGRFGAYFHCTNDHWIQVKNTAGTATLIGYDGIQTK